MRCRSCGYLIPEDTPLFCPECGKAVENSVANVSPKEDKKDTEKKNSKDTGIVIAIIAVIILIGGVLAVLWFTGVFDKDDASEYQSSSQEQTMSEKDNEKSTDNCEDSTTSEDVAIQSVWVITEITKKTENGTTVRTVKYHDNNRILSIIEEGDEADYQCIFDYDENGVTVQDTVIENGEKWITTYEYYSDGKMKSYVFYLDGEKHSSGSCSYDENGNRVESLSFDVNGNRTGSVERKFDNRRNVIEEKYLDADGKELYVKKYEYTVGERLLREDTIVNGVRQNYIVHEYDSRGLKIRTTECNADSTEKSCYVFHHDSKDRLEYSEFYLYDENSEKTLVHTQYFSYAEKDIPVEQVRDIRSDQYFIFPY